MLESGRGQTFVEMLKITRVLVLGVVVFFLFSVVHILFSVAGSKAVRL